MKYKSLVGRKFDCTHFKYLYSSWDKRESTLSSGRGSWADRNGAAKHQIETEFKCLMGVECIYEAYGEHNFFIYPVSELERTGQLTKEDLLEQTNNSYEIF